MYETWKEKYERQNKESQEIATKIKLREIARKLKMRVDRLNEEIELSAPRLIVHNELKLIKQAFEELKAYDVIVDEEYEKEEDKKEDTAEDFTKALAGAMLLHALLQITDL